MMIKEIYKIFIYMLSSDEDKADDFIDIWQ